MWILIIILHGFSGSSYTESSHPTDNFGMQIEFFSRKACDEAAVKTIQSDSTVTVYCVAKGNI